MTELPRAKLITSIEISPELLAKIEECVQECVSTSLSVIVEEKINEMNLEDIIERKIKEIFIEEYDVEELKHKMENEGLTKMERSYLKKKVLENLSDEINEIESGVYIGISFDGEILSTAQTRVELLLDLEKIDIHPSKIFLHRIGQPFIGRI